MANTNYEDILLDTIEKIVDNAVQSANYDKTIQCTVINCIDPSIGKYKVKYQDSTLIAYSRNSEITYFNGFDVYVLIPGNDMTRDKTILGTVKQLGVDYVGITEDENAYERVGNNCIDSSEIYELCSYEPDTKKRVKILYDRENGIDEIRLNTTSVETYIRKSSSVICGGMFQTKLPIEQQFRGNFGIVFELTFLDNASEAEVTRNYIVDVNQMLGNPYKQTKWMRQYGIFNLDAVNFKEVSRIYIFVDDFPNQKDGQPADIFIKDLEFCGAVESDPLELNSYGMVFYTPQGTYFDDKDLENATRKIQAQVRVKGKDINNTSQSLSYYWFVENVGVTTSHPSYNVYGGQGWECKNLCNLVGEDEDGKPIYEWTPSEWEYIVNKKDSQAKETKYKCVAIYNDVILSKEIIITNYDSQWEINIESDRGTQFYYDIGHPTLTCKVNGEIKSADEFTYVWAEIDSANNFSSLPETFDFNKEYNDAVSAYNQLLKDIEEEKEFLNKSESLLQSYLTTINNYNKIRRVERMFIHDLQINQIITFATYKCSVYYSGNFIGSASIIIYNSLDTENGYSLIINNGTQVFKYDESGISPVNTSLDTPIKLQPLTFTLYDNLGQPIDNEILERCEVKWIVPSTNTLLDIPNVYGEPDEVDLINGTETYKNLMIFSYLIANRYDITKTNNNIQLIVNYKDMILVAKTNFTFTKEGEPGTNGTEFTCRIVPNFAGNETTSEYPMILNGELNYTPREAKKWFRFQFWHNGEMIFNGTQSGPLINDNNKNLSLTWSILTNKYTDKISDNTDIKLEDNGGELTGKFEYLGYNINSNPANIIKCTATYEGINYYATIPLITGIINKDYKVKLKEGSGFRFATYSADGRRPKYDNSNPFELIITKKINEVWEDISRMKKEEKIEYQWNLQGEIYNPVNKQWEIKDCLIEQKYDKLEYNQRNYKPIDEFNGECLNIGLECFITKDSNQIGSIHIPVHLLLNKYGQAAINDWDGNHVSIDKNGCGIILAPQIGAGIKESNNSFTGMLMGEVKEINQSHSDVGLTGYYQGERTLHISAYDGYAIFGKTGPGQIILDPTSGQAMLYSHNFWKDYYDDTTDSKKNGLPKTNYTYNADKIDEETGKIIEGTHKYDGQAYTNISPEQTENHGMLIDLTAPRILFGNGNFRVEPNGFLYAKGGGEIAGWYIDDYKIHSKDGKNSNELGKTGMSSVYDGSAKGVTLKSIKVPTGSAAYTTDNVAVAFWAGTNKFFVSHNGYLKAEEASIGSGINPIFIGKSNDSGGYSAIWSGTKSHFNANASGFYIGTNGIALGNYSNNHSNFEVTSSGTLYAKSGTVGGWTVGSTSISSGNVTLSTGGNIDCSGGKGWYIHSDGSASFGMLQISADGNITTPGFNLQQIVNQLGQMSAKLDANSINAINITVNGNPVATEGYANSVADTARKSANSYTDDEIGKINDKFKDGKTETITLLTSSVTDYTFHGKKQTLGGYAITEIWQGGTDKFKILTFTNGILTNVESKTSDMLTHKINIIED